jgi:hypothetical protein
LQNDFWENRADFGKTVENPSGKKAKLANLQIIFQKDEYFGRYDAFSGRVLSRIFANSVVDS